MYFAGIDAHAQYLQVAVLDKDGNLAVERSVGATDGALATLLQPYRPLRVVVEACPFWPWVRDQVRADGVVFTLAHARELRAIAHHAQKNDVVDARLLARMLMTGLVPPAYAHTTAQLDELRLIRHHQWLVQNRTRYANRIHSQLHQSGIQLPRERLLTIRGREEIRALRGRLTREQQRLIRTHFRLIRTLDDLLAGLKKQIVRCAANSPGAVLLRSVPGIGAYWSLLLAGELMPIERFPSADHLVSYAGLAPITKASGGQIHHGPIPSGANRWVRGALVTATMSHVRHAPATAISKYYTQTKARLGWKKARVAAARKLARACYVILKTQQPYRDVASRNSGRSMQDDTAKLCD